MQFTSLIPDIFRQLIISILKPFPEMGNINKLVKLCHKMAVAYLRTKIFSNRYSEKRFGVNIDDLAFDVIADIFARDNNGNFVVIHKYFRQLGDISVLSDDELFAGFAQISIRCNQYAILQNLCRT